MRYSERELYDDVVYALYEIKTNPNPHLVAMRYGNVVLPYILRSAVLLTIAYINA